MFLTSLLHGGEEGWIEEGWERYMGGREGRRKRRGGMDRMVEMTKHFEYS